MLLLSNKSLLTTSEETGNRLHLAGGSAQLHPCKQTTVGAYEMSPVSLLIDKLESVRLWGDNTDHWTICSGLAELADELAIMYRCFTVM